MSKLDRDLDHAKNKVSGEAKEAAGKITGNEKLELKGKMQSSKADVQKNINKIADKVDHAKDDLADSTNKVIDKHNKNNKR